MEYSYELKADQTFGHLIFGGVIYRCVSIYVTKMINTTVLSFADSFLLLILLLHVCGQKRFGTSKFHLIKERKANELHNDSAGFLERGNGGLLKISCRELEVTSSQTLLLLIHCFCLTFPTLSAQDEYDVVKKSEEETSSTDCIWKRHVEENMVTCTNKCSFARMSSRRLG
ncbi:hypothetical protein RB195_004846 [Necator americanus]|uniref:ShKT domain-containing protein n=1 Tax=Necator americanus TaxID=51031 RepID=A0ABR1BNI5_NECAM